MMVRARSAGITLHTSYFRSRAQVVLLVGCIALANGFAASSARGQPAEPEPAPSIPTQPLSFRVHFSSTTACQDPSEFTRQLLARTKRLRRADGAKQAIVFQVRLSPGRSGVLGQLFIREPGASGTLRNVPGENCRAVIAAMALIAAIHIDPLAATGPIESTSRLSGPGLLPDAGAHAPARRLAPTPQARAASKRTPWSFEAGQRLNAQTAIAPGWTLGTSVHVQLSYAVDQVLSPAIRVGGHFAQHAVESSQYGSAEFTWTALRFSLCPIRLALQEDLAVRPCALAEAGQLDAAGYDTQQGQSHSVFWSAAGAGAFLEAVVLGPLSAGLDIGVLLPLVRHDYHFLADRAPSTENIHRIPVAGFSLALGLGLRFP